MTTEINKNLNNLYISGTILVAIMCIVGLLYSYNLYQQNKFIGSASGNTINISGTGKVSAKPDIATISLTIREGGKDLKEAQDKASVKSDTLLKSLKATLDEKDIKTNNYSSNPTYIYSNTPNYQNPKISGYEVTQNIALSIREVKNISEILKLIADANINEVNGPSYSIDNPEKYKEEARGIAIKDAKDKAAKLADQLGVNIVRMISFNEIGDYNPTPYAMMRSESKAMGDSVSVPIPTLPMGENEISSNINITFEIK